MFGLDENGELIMDMPKRPSWSYKVDKLHLEKEEEKYFREYITHFYAKAATVNQEKYSVALVILILNFSQLVML